MAVILIYFQANRVVIAIHPSLVNNLQFQPPLPHHLKEVLSIGFCLYYCFNIEFYVYIACSHSLILILFLEGLFNQM